MGNDSRQNGHRKGPAFSEKLAAKSIVLLECGLCATVIDPDRPRPQIALRLGKEKRVVSFGAFLTFCLDAISVCQQSMPAETQLLVERPRRRTRPVNKR
jgi:hypothetical protein